MAGMSGGRCATTSDPPVRSSSERECLQHLVNGHRIPCLEPDPTQACSLHYRTPIDPSKPGQVADLLAGVSDGRGQHAELSDRCRYRPRRVLV